MGRLGNSYAMRIGRELPFYLVSGHCYMRLILGLSVHIAASRASASGFQTIVYGFMHVSDRVAIPTLPS
jgi:hypothetical protein